MGGGLWPRVGAPLATLYADTCGACVTAEAPVCASGQRAGEHARGLYSRGAHVGGKEARSSRVRVRAAVQVCATPPSRGADRCSFPFPQGLAAVEAAHFEAAPGPAVGSWRGSGSLQEPGWP